MNSVKIFTSNRYFTLFDFLISHGQLLLRSSKNDKYTDNVDIIFFDVQYIQLHISLHGLSVSCPDKSELANLIQLSSSSTAAGKQIFEIKSGDANYYIAASYFTVYENQLEFNETSLGVLESKGRLKEVFSLK